MGITRTGTPAEEDARRERMTRAERLRVPLRLHLLPDPVREMALPGLVREVPAGDARKLLRAAGKTGRGDRNDPILAVSRVRVLEELHRDLAAIDGGKGCFVRLGAHSNRLAAGRAKPSTDVLTAVMDLLRSPGVIAGLEGANLLGLGTCFTLQPFRASDPEDEYSVMVIDGEVAAIRQKRGGEPHPAPHTAIHEHQPAIRTFADRLIPAMALHDLRVRYRERAATLERSTPYDCFTADVAITEDGGVRLTKVSPDPRTGLGGAHGFQGPYDGGFRIVREAEEPLPTDGTD